MSGVAKVLTLGVVAGAAAWGGLMAGERGVTLTKLREAAVMQVSMLRGGDAVAIPVVASTGAVIYGRHPDGLPEWSATERQTAEGRAFLPVRASEDVSLDPTPDPAPAATDERRILYYRNPMGLPDTSPVPTLDSMGMAYIPV